MAFELNIMGIRFDGCINLSQSVDHMINTTSFVAWRFLNENRAKGMDQSKRVVGTQPSGFPGKNATGDRVCSDGIV